MKTKTPPKKGDNIPIIINGTQTGFRQPKHSSNFIFNSKTRFSTLIFVASIQHNQASVFFSVFKRKSWRGFKRSYTLRLWVNIIVQTPKTKPQSRRASHRDIQELASAAKPCLANIPSLSKAKPVLGRIRGRKNPRSIGWPNRRGISRACCQITGF